MNKTLINSTNKPMLALKNQDDQIILCLYKAKSSDIIDEFKYSEMAQQELEQVMEKIDGPPDDGVLISLLDESELYRLYPYLGVNIRKSLYKKIHNFIDVDKILDESNLSWKNKTLLTDFSKWNSL